MQSPQCKPIDSTRIGTGQSRFRGRVRCLNHLIAWERRRREPGSNSVIITIALTRDEGYVVGLGGLQRVRKIFVGCPAIRPFWDQSPGIRNPRLETVGNRLYPLHDQDCLRRFTAEAQIQDRSRAKTGPNTAPGFSRVWHSNRLPHHHPTPPPDPLHNVEHLLEVVTADPPRHSRRRREPTEKQSTPFTPFREAKGAREPKRPQTDSGGCPQSPAPYPDTGAGTHRPHHCQSSNSPQSAVQTTPGNIIDSREGVTMSETHENRPISPTRFGGA